MEIFIIRKSIKLRSENNSIKRVAHIDCLLTEALCTRHTERSKTEIMGEPYNSKDGGRNINDRNLSKTHNTEGQCNKGQRRQTGGEEERKQLEDTAELNQKNKT